MIGDAACDWPGKEAYENRSAVLAALRRMPARHKKHCHPYQCHAGHWHLGRRIRRSTVAWRSEP